MDEIHQKESQSGVLGLSGSWSVHCRSAQGDRPEAMAEFLIGQAQLQGSSPSSLSRSGMSTELPTNQAAGKLVHNKHGFVG